MDWNVVQRCWLRMHLVSNQYLNPALYARAGCCRGKRSYPIGAGRASNPLIGASRGVDHMIVCSPRNYLEQLLHHKVCIASQAAVANAHSYPCSTVSRLDNALRAFYVAALAVSVHRPS